MQERVYFRFIWIIVPEHTMVVVVARGWQQLEAWLWGQEGERSYPQYGTQSRETEVG